MQSPVFGYTSLKRLLQLIEYFDLPMDARVFAADATDEAVFHVSICEAVNDTEVALLLAPEQDTSVADDTLTLNELLNACPDECEYGDCHFLTSRDGMTLMTAAGLQFRDGNHDEIVIVFVPCESNSTPYTNRTLH